MHAHEWEAVTKVNEFTGKVSTRHLRIFATDDRESRVYTQVYELDGRYYWSANIYVAFRPDLTRLVTGRYAAVPGALAVAKQRASRCALESIRASRTRRHAR